MIWYPLMLFPPSKTFFSNTWKNLENICVTDPITARIKDPEFCVCCGSRKFEFSPLLWPELVAEWEISEYEVAYVNRQQFFKCQTCGCNLRSMALGKAIMQCYGYKGLFSGFVKSFQARRLHTLEVNTAGDLTQFLARLPKRTLACYPDVDMMCMPYKNETYDLVLHSETLEHVPDPVKAMAECHRVLKPGGFCCFTIPVIVDRTTRSRNRTAAQLSWECGRYYARFSRADRVWKRRLERRGTRRVRGDKDVLAGVSFGPRARWNQIQLRRYRLDSRLMTSNL